MGGPWDKHGLAFGLGPSPGGAQTAWNEHGLGHGWRGSGHPGLIPHGVLILGKGETWVVRKQLSNQ